MMTEHSIAICNYNMVNTVEESVRSIVNQLDSSFEVIIVDDGSDDGSLEILRQLESEYSCIKLESLNYDPNRYLGETRNISFEKSRGEYILESLDTDDKYDDVILDFVEIYHQINSQVDMTFYLKGKGINMAPRELLLSIPYRNLGRGQDRDLWRRLFANDAIIWLDHGSFCEPLGYEPNFIDRLDIMYNQLVTEFRSGITFRSFVRDTCRNPTDLKNVYNLAISPFAYVASYTHERYDAPDEFEKVAKLEQVIKQQRSSLQEIEENYDIVIDQDSLSEKGKEIFYQND
jgi:glycosyltransferase involved in cell wall biosynthesis